MRKYFAILLVVLLAFTLIGCTETPAPVTDPTTEVPPVTEPTKAPDPAPEKTAEPEPEPEPVVETAYAPYALQFKNKTGVNITGLYLYVAGAEDKGNSICPELWMDADADKAASMIYVYVVRPAGATLELYVEWEDGTNATLPGITLENHDKFSMKGGVDPAGWEHEPMDDAEEIAAADALVEAGKTSDNFYGDYAVIGLEIKNKTGKDIEGFYFYEAGVEHTTYNNMIDHVLVFNEEGTELVPVAKPWVTGKGGQYVFSFFIRPVAEYYEVHLVFTDGTTLTIPEIDLFTPNAEGFCANELSMKSADDPYGTVPAYDDGDPEPLQFLKDAIARGTAADGWYPTF